MTQSRSPLKRLWRTITEQVIQDVPGEIALCAMDCDKDQCTREEWEVCDRRHTRAAGELMPEAGEPPSVSAGAPPPSGV
jgi:hypothetical protein